MSLLVGVNGYPIGYEIFEGNKFEGHTFLPMLEKYRKKFNINKPIIVSDAGLLSKENIKLLEAEGYKFILGGRIKNENQSIRNRMLKMKFKDSELSKIKKDVNSRLIVSYSSKRARKDEYNRKRGLARLEKNLQSKK